MGPPSGALRECQPGSPMVPYRRMSNSVHHAHACIGSTRGQRDPLQLAEHCINDCIATQIYPTPEIMIGSPVMSRNTSEPSGGRSRMMVAIVAGCRSFRTFRDSHTSIAFTTVGPQHNLAHIFG